MEKIRAIISGGGTGGHIFPAVSIAGALLEACPESEVLFVGAKGRMEMEKVPAAGYEIVGLPISGLQRKLTLSNVAVPFKAVFSIFKAMRIVRKFRPDVCIGVGGYASAPLLFAAQIKGVPTLIQEQNGFAGLANRILGKRARCICVAYDSMERFFPADRIVKTGNPIRSSIHPSESHERGRNLLLVGGSLGAGTLNSSMRAWIEAGCPGRNGAKVLWQCGKYYFHGVDAFMKEASSKGLPTEGIEYSAFLGDMDRAYAWADLVVTRAGASSVSELCAMGKAALFVPSPNVAEDHQTCNAMALVRGNAARIVRDADAPQSLMKTAMELLDSPATLSELEKNISKLALPDAAGAIVREVYKLLGK